MNNNLLEVSNSNNNSNYNNANANNANKIKRDLTDIKLLVSVLQNRIEDLETLLTANNNIQTYNIDNKIKIYDNDNKETNISNIEKTIAGLSSKDEELKSRGEINAEAGIVYELKVYNIVSQCYIRDTDLLFNTQDIEDIEDLSKEYDLVCNWEYDKFCNQIEIPIELKKYRTPDWGQCNLQFNTHEKRWEVSETSIISDKLRSKLNNMLKKEVIFRNEEPIFFKQKLKTTEWYDIKSANPEDWSDHVIDLQFDFINEYYTYKGNNYIQISNGYGLYYLGNYDICNFGVPHFDTPQKLRIRVRKMRIRSGYIKLVVTASASPVNYCSELPKSPYSFDNKDKLPNSLQYNNNKK